MHIYEIRNKLNERKLIGQTIQKNPRARWRGHKSKLRKNIHENIHLQRAWNKYGESNFEFVIVCEVDTIEELNREEITRIAADKNVYNILPGGENGPLPEVTKRRISLARRGKPGPWLGKKRPKLGELNKVRVWTEEAREKIAAANRLRVGEKHPAQSENVKKRKRDEKGRWIE